MREVIVTCSLFSRFTLLNQGLKPGTTIHLSLHCTLTGVKLTIVIQRKVSTVTQLNDNGNNVYYYCRVAS